MPQPDDQPSVDADASNESDAKPTGYETIKPRLKEVRENIIREINRGDGGIPVTTLRREDRADIPGGSVEHHLAWLQGREVTGESLRWWPDGAGAIIQEVGREDMGYANPVRVFGFTEYGQRFATAFVDEEPLDTREKLSNHSEKLRQHDVNIGEVRNSLDTAQSRHNDLRQTVSGVQERVNGLESAVGRFEGGRSDERNESIHERLNGIEQRLDELESIKEHTETLIENAEQRRDN